MKRTQAKLPIALLTGALLALTPAIMAEEAQVEPQIVICDGFIDTGIVFNDEVSDDEVTIDDEVIADDGGKADDEEVIVDDGEVVDSDEDPQIVICWDHDWVKRGDGDETDPNIYYMFSNGPAAENTSSDAAGTATSVNAENEAIVPSKAEKQTPVANVQRAAVKPTAVKANGRVFLR